MHYLLMGDFLETVVSLGLENLVDLASSPPVSQSDLPGSPSLDCHPSSGGSVHGSQNGPEHEEDPPSKKMRLTPSPSQSSNGALSRAVSPSAASKSSSTCLQVNTSASTSSDSATISPSLNKESPSAPPQPLASIVDDVAPDDDVVEHLEQSMSVAVGMKVCPECGDKVDKRIFKRHLESHTEPGPFKCNLCGQEFSRLDNLKRHNEDRCPRLYLLLIVLNYKPPHSIKILKHMYNQGPSGVLLKIRLKQGKEERLLARKKDCWQGF